MDKILVSEKELYGNKGSFKYFIGYDDNYSIRPLCVIPLQMIGSVKYFKDGNKNIYFEAVDKKLFKKCIKIWGKLAF